MNTQTVRYWPTDKAYTALGGKSHAQVDRDLARDLHEMARARRPSVPPGGREGMTTQTKPASTLDGWLPQPGAFVWQQMYDPLRPSHDSTIEERVAAGETYGQRRLMRVIDIQPGYGGNPDLTRYVLRDPQSKGGGLFPTDGTRGTSWTESDWCVLTDANEEAGVLF